MINSWSELKLKHRLRENCPVMSHKAQQPLTQTTVPLLRDNSDRPMYTQTYIHRNTNGHAHIQRNTHRLDLEARRQERHQRGEAFFCFFFSATESVSVCFLLFVCVPSDPVQCMTDGSVCDVGSVAQAICHPGPAHRCHLSWVQCHLSPTGGDIGLL